MNTKNQIHALTVSEINRQVAIHSARRRQIVEQRASIYAAAQKNGSASDAPIIDADEKAAREHAKKLLNGAAPASLSALESGVTLDKFLYREKRGIDIALKILDDQELVAKAVEAVEWGEAHSAEWRQLAREITLTAVRLDALDARRAATARRLSRSACRTIADDRDREQPLDQRGSPRRSESRCGRGGHRLSRRNQKGRKCQIARDRVRAFTGPTAEKKAERVGHWFRAMTGNEKSRAWCIEKGIGLTKATAENVNTIGGFLAPEDFDEAIINIRETSALFARAPRSGRRALTARCGPGVSAV